MAIWQFKFEFIPEISVIRKYGSVPDQLSVNHEGWERHVSTGDWEAGPDFEDAFTEPWWLPLNVDVTDVFPFLETMGQVQQWTANSEGFRKFGEASLNDIAVSYNEKNIVEDLGARLDLRSIDQQFLTKAFLLATHFGCLLMDRQARLFKPDYPSFEKIMKLSNSFRFVSGPQQFLDDLASGAEQPE